MRILRILLAIRETSAPYNQFSLPRADKDDITLCTYFRSDITPPRSITLFEGDSTLPGFFRALKAALSAKEYDLVHIHSPHLGLLFLIARLFLFRTSAAPVLITVHDSYPNYKLRNRLMFIPVFAAFQRIVCCSRASYESFPVFYKKIARERLCYVQNGLDVARVDRTAANIHPQADKTGRYTVAAISRLVDIKNPNAVLAAFQESAGENSRLVYMGDGPLRGSLLLRCREMGIESQVEFTGLIPREEVFERLLNADLFISASHGEGLPVSVLEAMACRCPVLLSDIPPHREIADGVDFIPLIDPDDAPGFAFEIKKFSDMNEQQRAEIGEKCRKLIEVRFSLSAMHAGYEEIYDQVTSDQTPSLLKKLQGFLPR